MKNTRKLILTALFLALGYVLPFLTGQVPAVGKMLLPMHIPVLLCGFVCGWQYGLMVGFVVPLFRSVLAGMPVMMPTAVGMAFELATYGMISGLLYRKLTGKSLNIYITLIGAMLGGRIVWGIVSILLYGIQGNVFSWQLFISGALLNAVPGIVLQLVLIPVIVLILEKAGLIDEYVG
jgi:riboflavin transporter FmnP